MNSESMPTDRENAETGGKISRTLEVSNQYGIHARPAALFVKTANQYVSDIRVEHKGMEVSAKSIMGLLTIEGYRGAKLTVSAEGADAHQALEAIQQLFDQKFLED